MIAVEILFTLLRGRKDCNEKRARTPKWLISKNLIIELRLINNLDIISKGSGELSLSFYSASPNEQPVGITAPTGRATEQVGIANSTDILKISAEK